jgi:hypothetical protein
MNRNNNNNQNNQRNKNNRNKQYGQRNQHNENKEQKDKKVPMHYQIQSSKETNSAELKYTDMDGSVDKTKLNIPEDGTDEEFLKLIKEFQKYVDTYEIWNDEHAAHTVYKNFRRCLAGAARDLWDQINEIDEGEARDELSFTTHVQELTSAILGDDAL